MKKALIIRFSSLGDIILTLPIVKILSENNYTIYYLTYSDYREALIENPYITKLLFVEKKETNIFNIFNLIKDLKKYNFDIVFNLHKNLKSIAITNFLNTKTIYNKKYTFFRFLLKIFKINFLKKRESLAKEYVKLLKKVGIKKKFNENDMWLYINHEREKVYLQIESFLYNYVIINPNSSKPTKCLPIDKIIYITKFILEHTNKNIVLIGTGHEELLKCEKILSKIPSIYKNRIKIYANKTTIFQLIIIIKNCDLLITNDSGPMHIAGSFQKNTIAFFGPTTKEFGFIPENKNLKIFQIDLKCRPCSLHGDEKCKLKHFKCMKLIDKKEVCKYIKEVVNNEM
jgi:heptosyltransferase-2